MTQEQILEGNKHIVEFMDGTIRKDGEDLFCIFDSPSGRRGEFLSDLQYHQAWNWLMPVVEKIECTMGDAFNVDISDHRCTIFHNYRHMYIAGDIGFTEQIFHETDSKIESTWLSVVDFIRWYNKNC